MANKTMHKKLLYIANWKTYLTHNQAIAWCQKYSSELAQLSPKAEIIICPNFTALAQVKPLLGGTLALGAQNCSAFEVGAHTGDVDAVSLQELGVQYCIVGHSECRSNNNETPELVTEKVSRLIECGITPIVCVSDDFMSEIKPIFEIMNARMLRYTSHMVGTQHERISNAFSGKTQKSFCPVHHNSHSEHDQQSTHAARGECPAKSLDEGGCIEPYEQNNHIIIAYEPISAIGTGQVPTNTVIETTLQKIEQKFQQNCPDVKILLIYGGSVNPESIQELKKISCLHGFLIGKASTDFQKLKNIVE